MHMFKRHYIRTRKKNKMHPNVLVDNNEERNGGASGAWAFVLYWLSSSYMTAGIQNIHNNHNTHAILDLAFGATVFMVGLAVHVGIEEIIFRLKGEKHESYEKQNKTKTE